MSARPAVQLLSVLVLCSSTPQAEAGEFSPILKVNRRLAREHDTPDGDTSSDDSAKKRRTFRNEVRHIG